MKTRILITIINILLSASFLQAQVVKIINVATPGTLGTLVGSEKTTITDLTLTGTINAADFTTIKQMTVLKDLNMKDVNITDGTIPGNIFKNKIMNTIILPVNIKKIGQGAFMNMTISSLDFSNCLDLEEVQLQAFNNLKLTNNILDFSNNLKVSFPYVLNNTAFSHYSGHVILPENATKITTGLFRSFTGTIEIPSTVETIEGGAFMNANLTRLNLPAALKTIGSGAFNGATIPALDFSVCPDLEQIDLNAFSNIKLTNNILDFSNNPKVYFPYVLNNTAFSHYSGHVILPENATKITTGLFRSFTGTIEIPPTIEIIEGQAFMNANLTSLNLPAALKTIGSGAFNGATIPSLDFSNCPNLERVEYAAFAGIKLDNNTLNFHENTKVSFPVTYNNTAFSGSSNHVILPKNMKSLTYKIFYRFQGSVDFPQDLEMIGEHAFYEAVLSRGLRFPSSLRVIGDGAFYNATIPSIEFEGMDNGSLLCRPVGRAASFNIGQEDETKNQH